MTRRRRSAAAPAEAHIGPAIAATGTDAAVLTAAVSARRLYLPPVVLLPADDAVDHPRSSAFTAASRVCIHHLRQWMGF